MILVTGDVVLDHNIYAGKRLASDSDAALGMHYRSQPGGAALTYGLLEAMFSAARPAAVGNATAIPSSRSSQKSDVSCSS